MSAEGREGYPDGRRVIMDHATKTIHELRVSAAKALSVFQKDMKKIVKLEHDGDIGPVAYAHDNVRIVTGIECPHELDVGKYQVLVVLVGEFTLIHGNQQKPMVATDVCKVPSGSPYKTIMTTDDVNAKFVYMQFE